MIQSLHIKRKQFGVSQEQLAAALGMTRQTLAKVENGERELTAEEQQKAEAFFESFDIEEKAEQIRFNIPQENTEKFKQVLLYILEKVGAKPNVGMTVLYKLLYFIDFDYYEKYQKYLVGAKYIKNTHGPTPVSFAKITRDLEKNGELVEIKSKYFGFDQTKYVATKEPRVSLLSAQELKHIDDELNRLASKSARELSDLSHKDTPWKVAKDRQELNYRHVFYRPDETSVSED